QRRDLAVLEWPISDSGNDQQIASASRCDIGHAYTFREIATVLLGHMIDQFPRRAIRYAHGAEIGFGIDVTARLSRSGIRCHISENHDRKFETFGGMYSHDPHAF